MMGRETCVFLIMIACGAALSVLFDLLRAFRRIIKQGTVAVNVSDTLFWIMAAFVVTACVWNFNGGIFRIYEVVGILLGCVFYFLLLSRWILKAFLFIIENILKFVRLILKILLTPWGFLYKILIVPVKFAILNKIREVREKRK